jgi:hypothetical protein
MVNYNWKKKEKVKYWKKRKFFVTMHLTIFGSVVRGLMDGETNESYKSLPWDMPNIIMIHIDFVFTLFSQNI